VRLEPARLEFRPAPGLPADLPSRLGTALHRLTGRRWLVVVVNEGGAPTLAAQAEAARRRRIAELHGDPQVRAVLDIFPGSRIVDVGPAEPAGRTSPEPQDRKSSA
jgi:DNA polymerase-3 subunit gamma/tau